MCYAHPPLYQSSAHFYPIKAGNHRKGNSLYFSKCLNATFTLPSIITTADQLVILWRGRCRKKKSTAIVPILIVSRDILKTMFIQNCREGGMRFICGHAKVVNRLFPQCNYYMNTVKLKTKVKMN